PPCSCTSILSMTVYRTVLNNSGDNRSPCLLPVVALTHSITLILLSNESRVMPRENFSISFRECANFKGFELAVSSYLQKFSNEQLLETLNSIEKNKEEVGV
ncbi:MAG: hypothetical protein MUE72_10155, partial [Chitinophagaceae bacterium]|nr:hypothetical protein [Chitinophagaceae bacterium]